MYTHYTYIYIYIHILHICVYTYMHMYMCMYIYICIERERDKYIYIYIHIICTYIYIYTLYISLSLYIYIYVFIYSSIHRPAARGERTSRTWMPCRSVMRPLLLLYWDPACLWAGLRQDLVFKGWSPPKKNSICFLGKFAPEDIVFMWHLAQSKTQRILFLWKCWPRGPQREGCQFEQKRPCLDSPRLGRDPAVRG